MKKSAVLLAVAGLATAASAQSFAIYSVDGVNLTDGGRGTNNAQAGDVIRMSLRVEHDGHGFGGGKVDIGYGGVADGDITITEPNNVVLPPDVLNWSDLSRHPHTRIVVSDGPGDSIQSRNEDVVANGGTISDVNDDFFDFASTPPGLGGLSGPFPITSGDSIFNFDYVYQGGVDSWDALTNGEARLWRDGADNNGAVVDARNGETFFVSPAPASLALLGLGGLVAGRRRR